jgi:hypothetical protein
MLDRGRRAPRVLSAVLSGCLTLSACGSSISSPDPQSLSSTLNWQPLMSQSEMDTVRQTFPNFIPAKVAPGSSVGSGLPPDPSTFAPALFLGEPTPQSSELTPSGIEVETNDYDGPGQPVLLPDHGTYFDSQNNPYQFQLGPLDLVPLNKLEARMHVPLTVGAPVLTVNRRSGRVDLVDIDRILLAVQSSLAIRLPQVASIDIHHCRISIEPTIFFLQQSNFGPGWAGASTQDLGNGNFRTRLTVFFISGDSKVIVNWQMYLVDEAINFFVLSIGRPDLAQ